MKNYWKLLLCAAMGIGTFTACEDVPEPYNIPTENSNVPVINKDLILNQSFTANLGDFQSLSESGSLAWAADTRYGAVITGYQDFDGDGNKENKAGVTYLISPDIDLSEADSAYVIIDQAINYAKTTLEADHAMLIRTAGTEAWGTLPMSFDGLGNSFTYATQNVQIPQNYMGQKVQLALKHIAHDSYSSTWEVKTIQVSKGQAPTGEVETPVEGLVGSGTKDDPYDVPSTIKLIAAGPPSAKIYTKGIVSQVNEINTQYGNATYFISNDGTTANQLEVYRGLGLGGAKFNANGIKVGDEVIVYGQVIYYNNQTMEFTQGNELYSLNGETSGSGGTPSGDAKGDGTLANPYNAAAANAVASALAADAKSDQAYYIKGKVVSIATDKDGNVQNYDYGTYGNASFYISDDGTANGQFYVYRALYLGNKKWTSGAGDILKVGDEVIVYAKLTNYRGNTPETAQGDCYLYSLNGKSEGGGDTPTPTPTGEEVTCAKAVELTNALDDGATSAETYTVTGYITEVVGSVSRNQQTFWMADTKDGGKVFEAYYANLPEGVSEFKTGMKVKITGQLMKYVKDGNVTPEIKNADVVILEGGDNNGGGDNNQGTGTIEGDKVTPSKSGDAVTFSGFSTTTFQIVNDHTENKAGTQLRIVSMEVTYADGAKETAVMADLGLENAANLATHTLGGLTLTFAQGESTNPPKYYNSGTAARMYAKNLLTIKGNKAITAIVLDCATGGYTGNELLYGIAAK